MVPYMLRRIALGVPTLLLTSILAFVFVALLPGDAVSAAVAESGEAPSPAAVEAMRHRLGLDQPVLTRYVEWLGDAVTGDLGESTWSGQQALGTITRGFEPTLELLVLAMIFSVLIGLPLGVISAVKRGTAVDLGARIFSVLGYSIPSFWIGTMAITIPAILWHYSPPVKYSSIFENPVENLRQYIVPSLILGYELAAAISRMTRSAMLEVLNHDYIRTAYSKGLARRVVVLRHALRNAMLPVLTVIGLRIPFLLGGAVVIETLFAIPGMGQAVFVAVAHRDFPVIQAAILVFGVSVIATNVVIDMSYSLLNPMVKYG